MKQSLYGHQCLCFMKVYYAIFWQPTYLYLQGHKQKNRSCMLKGTDATRAHFIVHNDSSIITTKCLQKLLNLHRYLPSNTHLPQVTFHISFIFLNTLQLMTSEQQQAQADCLVVRHSLNFSYRLHWFTCMLSNTNMNEWPVKIYNTKYLATKRFIK